MWVTPPPPCGRPHLVLDAALWFWQCNRRCSQNMLLIHLVTTTCSSKQRQNQQKVLSFKKSLCTIYKLKAVISHIANLSMSLILHFRVRRTYWNNKNNTSLQTSKKPFTASPARRCRIWPKPLPCLWTSFMDNPKRVFKPPIQQNSCSDQRLCHRH